MSRLSSQLAFLAALAAFLLAGGCGGPSGPPNVVIFFADDLGWRDVGFHGSEIRTPRIDALAAEGTEMTRFYAFPICSPSRGALMTGRSAIRLGLAYGSIRPWSGLGLPLDEKTMAQHFKAAGYFTALVGKWHLGHGLKAQHPNQRGFDHFYGHLTGAIDYFKHTRDGGLDWQRNGESIQEKGYTTELLAKEAERLIRRQKPGEPFFLYMPFNAPHVPLAAPASYGRGYGHLEDLRRTYAAVVTALDTAVGRVLDALEERGLADNTLVVFLSDNGGAKHDGADNRPFRGGKRDLLEGGIRVPCLVRWPGHVPAGGRCDQVQSIMDLLPTLAGAAGLPLEVGKPLDGRSRLPQWLGGAATPPENVAFATMHADSIGYAVLDGPWKYVREVFPDRRRVERLYRIGDDPQERHNLAREHLGVTVRLGNLAEAWQEAMPEAHTRMAEDPPDWKGPADWAASLR